MKVIVFLAEGFEEIEAITQVDILRRGNISVDTCSISEENYVKGAHGIIIKTDIKISDIKEEYDMIVLPGGMPGALNLSKNNQLISMIQKYDKNNKYIAAICAAPKVLYKAGILKGKKVTSYPGMLDNLYGFTYCEDKVVKDGNIITSRGPATAMDFALELVKTLEGENTGSSLKLDLLT